LWPTCQLCSLLRVISISVALLWPPPHEMSPLWFLAALLLELAQGVQDKSSQRAISALGEVSPQSVAFVPKDIDMPVEQQGLPPQAGGPDVSPEEEDKQEAELLGPAPPPAPVPELFAEQVTTTTMDHVPDEAEQIVKEMIAESIKEAPPIMEAPPTLPPTPQAAPAPNMTEEKEPKTEDVALAPGTTLIPLQEMTPTQEMTPVEEEKTIEATLDDDDSDEDGVKIDEHTGVPQSPEFREHEMLRRTEYAKIGSAKEKLMYLHNAFRCVHGSSPVEWDDSLESDMKAEMKTWTIEKGTAGLPQKSGVVANLFWNPGQSAPTPEESVGSWYEQCDNCTGGCSGFTDGCPSSTSTPTTQFRNLVRSDVKQIACVNSMDAKSLVCFYSAGPSNATSEVLPSRKKAKQCDAVAALSFTKKILCVSSYSEGDIQGTVTLHMTKCLGGASQSLLLRRGTLEFRDPAGTCMTVGQRATEDDVHCRMVTLTKCAELDKYQQWRTAKVDVYFNKTKHQERWMNPESNTTLRIRNRQIWSCLAPSRTPFLRLGR